MSNNGLELVPGALTATCRQAHQITGLPVPVTEHGVDFDDANDHLRAALIEDTLRGLAPAIADGLDVRGYLHWSLIDNSNGSTDTTATSDCWPMTGQHNGVGSGPAPFDTVRSPAPTDLERQANPGRSPVR